MTVGSMTENVFRVQWVPGSDSLLGTCHCGAEHLSQDPAEAWSWLLAHPDGHDLAQPVPRRGPRPSPRPVTEGAIR